MRSTRAGGHPRWQPGRGRVDRLPLPEEWGRDPNPREGGRGKPSAARPSDDATVSPNRSSAMPRREALPQGQPREGADGPGSTRIPGTQSARTATHPVRNQSARREPPNLPRGCAEEHSADPEGRDGAPATREVRPRPPGTGGQDTSPSRDPSRHQDRRRVRTPHHPDAGRRASNKGERGPEAAPERAGRDSHPQMGRETSCSAGGVKPTRGRPSRSPRGG